MNAGCMYGEGGGSRGAYCRDPFCGGKLGSPSNFRVTLSQGLFRIELCKWLLNLRYMQLVILVDPIISIMSTSSDTYIWATRGAGPEETDFRSR